MVTLTQFSRSPHYKDCKNEHCLHSYLLDQLVDFDQTCTETPLGQGKEMIRFWWPWPHFQGHTITLNSNFDQKGLSVPYLLNQMMNSDQTLCIASLGQLKYLFRFWCPWPNFQCHHTVKTVNMSLVCSHFINQWVDFDQTYTENLWDKEKKWLAFGDLCHIFKITSSLWMSNFDKKKLVCTLSLEPNDGFRPSFMYCIIRIVKRFD